MEEDSPPPVLDQEPYGAQPPAVRLWYELRLATRFLTRLPVLTLEFAGQTTLAAASWAFPVVGLGVGLIGALALGLAHEFGIPPSVSAILALAAMILVTGALHEDGLADTADGFGLTGDAERRLAAMRDTRTGAFGVVAVVVVFALRWSALAAVIGMSAGTGAAALVAAATISRGVLPYVMHKVPNARSDGLSAGAGRPELRPALLAMVIAAVIALFAFGFGGAVAALITAGIVGAGLAYIGRRLIGGQTGDVLGAIQQLCEAAVLIAAATFAP
jgi:adenosylcobinamide-GDP ribazoletransferase